MTTVTGYLPLIFMATTTLALAYLILSAGSHSNRLQHHDDDLDRHNQDIEHVHRRIDWLAGYPYPEPEPDRDPDPPDTQPIKGRHHQ